MNGASSRVYDGRKRLVLYLAAASVAAFELAVLYLSSRPNVSAAYRSYYITHGDKCYVPGAKPEIKIGEPIRITAGNFTETCPFIGEGWSIPEDWEPGPTTALRGYRYLCRRQSKAPFG